MFSLSRDNNCIMKRSPKGIFIHGKNNNGTFYLFIPQKKTNNKTQEMTWKTSFWILLIDELEMILEVIRMFEKKLGIKENFAFKLSNLILFFSKEHKPRISTAILCSGNPFKLSLSIQTLNEEKIIYLCRLELHFLAHSMINQKRMFCQL